MDPEDLLKHNIEYGQRQRMIRQLQNLQPQGPPCPHCGGPIPKAHVKLCMHCRNPLAWVGNYVCAPGEEMATRARVAQIEARQMEEQKKAAEGSIYAALLMMFFCICTFGFGLWCWTWPTLNEGGGANFAFGVFSVGAMFFLGFAVFFFIKWLGRPE